MNKKDTSVSASFYCFQYNGSFVGIGRCGDCRTFGGRFLYRGDCGRGMLFNIIYWLFGFLRMGTSGMTSQALGRRDLLEVTRGFVPVGRCRDSDFSALLLLQYPIREIAFLLLDTTDEVERLASLYFNICIWGAPAVLGLYGFSGWFIGMQNSRFPMFIAITECREYRGEPDLRLCVRHEGARGCDGNTDRSIWRLRDGCIPVVRILSEAVEYSCLLA